jgi:hypothetical protein
LPGKMPEPVNPLTRGPGLPTCMPGPFLPPCPRLCYRAITTSGERVVEWLDEVLRRLFGDQLPCTNLRPLPRASNGSFQITLLRIAVAAYRLAGRFFAGTLLEPDWPIEHSLYE